MLRLRLSLKGLKAVKKVQFRILAVGEHMVAASESFKYSKVSIMKDLYTFDFLIEKRPS